MSVTIFWCEWDRKQTDSHELLRLALERYLNHMPVVLLEKQRQGTNVPTRQKGVFSVSMAETEQGKPYFEDFLRVRFSISHSENLWACAFSDTGVGLDLQSEYMKNGERIARRFFHPEEIAWMEKNGFEHFSRIWTHKESYVKYTGLGLTRGLDYFSVVPWLDGKRLRLLCASPEFADKTALEEDNVNQGRWICQQEIPFQDGFWMVLTSDRPQEMVCRRLCGEARKMDLQ